MLSVLMQRTRSAISIIESAHVGGVVDETKPEFPRRALPRHALALFPSHISVLNGTPDVQVSLVFRPMGQHALVSLG